MKKVFFYHHKLNGSEKNELWKQAIFVFDTNILLNIYRYENSTRQDFFNVLRELKNQKRVWIPHQVLHEFYKRRLNVISEQESKYEELIDLLDKFSNDLSGGSFKKSDFLELQHIQDILNPSLLEAKKHIKAKKESHPELINSDELLESLASIIGDSIGADYAEAEKLVKYDEARTRIENKQPPGYKDAKKPEPEKFGDTIIWFQITEYAREVKKPIVFVTEDEKEDWWQIWHGKKLGPRPELRKELFENAGVDFDISRAASFLEHINNLYHLGLSEDSVANAESISNNLHRKEIINFNFLNRSPKRSISEAKAESIVYKWVYSFYPELEILKEVKNVDFDFVAYGKYDAFIELLVARKNNLYNIKSHIERFYGVVDKYQKKYFDSKFHLIIAVEQKEDIETLSSLLKNYLLNDNKRPYEITITLGYIDTLNEKFEDFININPNILF